MFIEKKYFILFYSENGGLSPPSGDNDSGKSTEADDFTSQHRNSNKITPYSEEGKLIVIFHGHNFHICCFFVDTLSNAADATTSTKKNQVPGTCKKRRRSFKGPVEEVALPAKRGRKPVLNRSRQNSDSDDTSEHSVPGSTVVTGGVAVVGFERRSPRPTKYNFFVELGMYILRISNIREHDICIYYRSNIRQRSKDSCFTTETNRTKKNICGC